MQRWLWLVILLPLAAPFAHAQGSGLVMNITPNTAHLAPGATLVVNVKLADTATHDMNVTITGMGADRIIAASVTPEHQIIPAGGYGNATIRVTIAANATPETRTLVVIARDPGGANATQTLTITVDAPRPAPTKISPSAAPTTSPPAVDLPATPTADPIAAPAAAPIPDPSAASTAAAAAAPSPIVSPALIVGASMTAGVGVAALLAAWAHKRWPLMAALLYTRLKRTSLLDHPLRAKIAKLVTEHPGVAFGELARLLGIGAGTLTHHARILQQAGVIFSVTHGQERRFYPIGGGRVAPVPPLAQRALELLSRHGPMSAPELAQSLGVSRQALHYHLKKLAKEGRVRAAEGVISATLPDVAHSAGAS